jgi:hypothetical protein
MYKKQYGIILIEIIYFGEDIRTDIISASYWDVGEPDIGWDED